MQEEKHVEQVVNHMQSSEAEQSKQQEERKNDSECCQGNDVFEILATTVDTNEKVTVTSFPTAPTVNENSHHSSVTQSRHRLSERKNDGAVSWTTDHEACVQDDLDLMHKILHCTNNVKYS